MNLHARMGLLFIGVLVSAGCVFDGSGESKSPSLVGKWESVRRPTYTLEDSLHRESLKLHMKAEGIDLDSFAFGGEDYPRDMAKFNALVNSFVWECPAEVACGKILYQTLYQKTFTEDTLFQFVFINGQLDDSSATAYDLAGGFLIQHGGLVWSTAQRYEFAGAGDTLRLWTDGDTLGWFSDTLARIE